MDKFQKLLLKQFFKVNVFVFTLLLSALFLRFNFGINASQCDKGGYFFAGIITLCVGFFFSLLYCGLKHGFTISKFSPGLIRIIRKEEKISFNLSILTSFLFFIFMGGPWIAMFFIGCT